MAMHTASIEEKTMAPVSGFFQTSFSSAPLRSAALAISLLVLASPARAEVVSLVCQSESGSSMTIQIDYGRMIVVFVEDGTIYDGGPAAVAATITENHVRWSSDGFGGVLNRLSGQAGVNYRLTYHNGGSVRKSFSGPCRRATQKF
jgi:hypothetical protein